MAFTISDVEDLIKLLAEHPEWRDRLRPVILGTALDEIPSRMDRVEAALLTLTERMDALTERMDALTERMDALTERMDALAERMDALAQEVRNLTMSVAELSHRTGRIEGDLGNLRGEVLELRFDRNLSKWVRQWLGQARLVEIEGMDLFETARRTGVVSATEFDEVAALDAIVVGRDPNGRADSWLAVELSQTINTDDVERAHARGQILNRAGYAVRSLVVGYRLSPQAERLAESLGVLVSVRRSTAA